MTALNFRHLRCFHAVAHEESLTRAAEKLGVSPSVLSIQIQKLEAALGQQVFDRNGKRMKISEAGRIVLDYADTIFRTGEEMVATLGGRGTAARQILRIGALSTLSRNFQLALIRPLLNRADVELVFRSGSLRELLAQLETHETDVVLANVAVPRDGQTRFECHLIDSQPVSLVGRPRTGQKKLRFPDDLARIPVLLPGRESAMRAGFDQLLQTAGITPTIMAEVDDMAMLRLLARESDGLTLVPPVVVQDELSSGVLEEHIRLPGLQESFYAITQTRRFPHPLLTGLLRRGDASE